MIRICTALPRGSGIAARTLLLSLAALLILGACSNDYNLGVTPSLGIAVNVALAATGGVTAIDEDTSTTLYATVSNDPTNQGVSWTMTPTNPGGAVLCSDVTTLVYGCLADVTNTTVVFVAPASGVTGALGVQIEATSIANPANNATLTMVTYGTPVITLEPQFPGNVNVPYAIDIAAQGGFTPYTWTLASGTLPPGLVLNGSASQVTSISGTPTAAGTYNFTVQLTDSNTPVDTATQNYTLVVNPQSACLLSGQFTLTFMGFRGGAQATYMANLTIGPTGTITGEQDYKDGARTTLDEQLDATSACTNRNTNSGVLTLNAPSGQLVFDFSATPPDANNVIHSARLQIIGSANTSAIFNDSGSGEMTLTDTSALTGAAPSGNFAFGLLGVDGNGVHYGTAGELSAASGTFSGVIDSNSQSSGASAPLGSGISDAVLSGTISPPDTLGRGTMTLQSGSSSETLVYYIVNANKLFVMNGDAAVNSARETGYMTTQTGDASASTFDNGGLAQQSVLSLWGQKGSINPNTVVALGDLYGSSPSAGTVNLVLDTANLSTDTDNVTYTAQPYSIDSSGRGTLAITTGGTTRNFVFYLDGVSDGYILEQGSTTGNVGLLEAQTVPSGGFTSTLNGEFVGDTQFPLSYAPVALEPLVQLAYGSLSSTNFSGDFAVDPTTGRGFGTVSTTGVGETADVLYVVSPTKVDLMNFATPTGTNGTISWLVQN